MRRQEGGLARGLDLGKLDAAADLLDDRRLIDPCRLRALALKGLSFEPEYRRCGTCIASVRLGQRFANCGQMRVSAKRLYNVPSMASFVEGSSDTAFRAPEWTQSGAGRRKRR
jgi:hypothetical protein